MNEIVQEVLNAAKESPRMYFAPLIGAALAIYTEAMRLRRQDPSDESSTTPEPSNTP